MKKKFFISLLLLSFIVSGFLFISGVEAQTYKNDTYKQLQAMAGQNGATYSAPSDPRLIAAYIIRLLLSFLGMIFLAYTVYAGYLILMSGGEEEKVNKGKSIIKYSVIGLLIILSAYSLTSFVYRILTGDAERTGNYLEVKDNLTPFYTDDPLYSDAVPFSPY
ncbi:MAG: pilin [Candidatus Magasanikiibacteriota bacterium]